MSISRAVELMKRLLLSPKFFKWIIAVFIIQAVLSALFVSISTPVDGIGGRYVERREDGVVPDGHRHVGAIYYYAERPILAGPIISDMPEDALWMGDLERFPSYLYYYLLSFPVRLAMMLNFSDTAIVLLIRFIGIALGLLALLVFRRIVQLISNNVFIQNVSSLALALTGSFVWLSAAENYDMIALLLWLLFIYVSIGLFKLREIRYVYWMVVIFFFITITKYTFLPFAGLFGLVAVALYGWNKKPTSFSNLRKIIARDTRTWIVKLKWWQLIAGSVLLLVGVGLFTERIVGNYVTYQSFNPNCEYIHSHEGCMKFGVYARDYKQVQGLASGEIRPIEYVPVVGYPAYWIERYYDSMYVYMGHVFIPQYSYWVEFGGLAIVLFGISILIWARIKKVRLIRSQIEWYAVAIIAVLTISQFIFNLNSMIYFGGQTYAHQGRYLLPVIGFVYVMYLVAAHRVYRQLSSKLQVRFIVTGGILGLYAVLVISTVPSFLIHATNLAWYSDFAQQILPEWLTRRT